jgi:endonuclease YncB( thermonuclease family)
MKKILSLLLTLCCAFGIFFGNTDALSAKAETAPTKIDYASQLSLSEDSQKLELSVKMFIDGDTTHFNAPTFPNGVFKARYSAVNTPESTGKLEEWGKKASKFTRSKLETATSIIVESEESEWRADSTGERYVCWVWYKAPGESEYRNLNVELLQEGLARGSSTGTSRYGEVALLAFSQAQALKLNIWSGEKDPDFFYGESTEIDLKELRLNIKQYENTRVAFEGIVAYYLNQGVYVESFDEETGMYFGIYVYYGFTSISAQATNILAIGNKVRITGVVQYYEGGQS